MCHRSLCMEPLLSLASMPSSLQLVVLRHAIALLSRTEPLGTS